MKINPGFKWNFFERNHIPYNLQRGDLLLLPPAKSTSYGVNSLAFRGSLLWNNIQSQVEESQTLEEFKNSIKNLRSINSTCTVCRWRIMPFYFNLQFISFINLQFISLSRTSIIVIYN